FRFPSADSAPVVRAFLAIHDLRKTRPVKLLSRRQPEFSLKVQSLQRLAIRTLVHRAAIDFDPLRRGPPEEALATRSAASIISRPASARPAMTPIIHGIAGGPPPPPRIRATFLNNLVWRSKPDAERNGDQRNDFGIDHHDDEHGDNGSRGPLRFRMRARKRHD